MNKPLIFVTILLFFRKLCIKFGVFFRTAKSCLAADHCIKKVWTGMSLPEDNDDVCKICKDMVAQARDQLLSNETQSDLKAVLEVCMKLPVPIMY